MLIVILIDVQYLQKAVLSFKKGLNRQNHSSLVSLPKLKECPPVMFLIHGLTGQGEIPSLPPLTDIWKFLIYKTLWPLFVNGMLLPQGYIRPL